MSLFHCFCFKFCTWKLSLRWSLLKLYELNFGSSFENFSLWRVESGYFIVFVIANDVRVECLVDLRIVRVSSSLLFSPRTSFVFEMKDPWKVLCVPNVFVSPPYDFQSTGFFAFKELSRFIAVRERSRELAVGYIKLFATLFVCLFSLIWEFVID